MIALELTQQTRHRSSSTKYSVKSIADDFMTSASLDFIESENSATMTNENGFYWLNVGRARFVCQRLKTYKCNAPNQTKPNQGKANRSEANQNIRYVTRLSDFRHF